jgi:hypothetical protein
MLIVPQYRQGPPRVSGIRRCPRAGRHGGPQTKVIQLSAITAKPARTRQRVTALAVLSGIITAASLACTLDPDDRCGPNQEIYGDNVRCVCVAGAVLTPRGCVLCGANEVAGESGCECAPGYVLAADGSACEESAMSGQGVDCNVDTPCADPLANHCEIAASGMGYCTTIDCPATACSGGYACDETVSPTICRRPPVGQGRSCASPADCAGTEATFCDTVESNSCLVQGCSLTPNDCFVGWSCCDLSSRGLATPLCLPEGACPT